MSVTCISLMISPEIGKYRERSRGEKIWALIARTDGTLQLNFGLGKYHNRGIIDGFERIAKLSQPRRRIGESTQGGSADVSSG